MENNENEEEHGLPDIEYKPLDTEEKPSSGYYYEEEDEDTSNSGLIIIVIFVMLVGVLLTYKFIWRPKLEKRIQQQTQTIVDDEMTLISTSPEGCKVYSLRGKTIIICPSGFNANEVK